MIFCILLASGLSRRFQGENKLFYQVEGLPMYRRALSCACCVREELKAEQGWEVQIVLVTAYEEIAAEAGKASALAVRNREPEAGIPTLSAWAFRRRIQNRTTGCCFLSAISHG